MPITLLDLVALRQRIETDIRRLQGELSAVTVLEQRLRAETSGQQVPLPLPDETPRTFAEAVRQAIRDFNNEEFTVANVENALRAQGAALPAKNARARIAMELSTLIKKHVITRTFKGVGSTPHRFRPLANDGSQPKKSEGVAVRPTTPSISNSRQPTLSG